MKKVINIPIQDVVPYSGSHNTDTVINLLKESIEKFGVQQPIVVDSNHNIVAGNAVYKACLALGHKDIPCVVLDDLTDDQIAQYRIADNKTGEFARWNEDKLRKELSFMSDPTSLQFCFDENVASLFAQPAPKVKAEPEAQPTIKSVSIEQLKEEPEQKNAQEAAFAANLRKIDEDNHFEQDKYFTYMCSHCGKKVTVNI